MPRSSVAQVSNSPAQRGRAPNGRPVRCAASSIRSIKTFIATVLLLWEPTFAVAQKAPDPVFGANPPLREGGIYDFRNHQPVQPAPPPAVTSKQVEDEVKALLEQVDELDRTFDDREGKDPRRR
jgi:hypothetical protein